MSYAFERYYEDEFENHKVVIFIGRDADPRELSATGFIKPGDICETQLYVSIEINGQVLREDAVRGGLVAGEFLRDAIGYGPAKDMLTRMKLPGDSLMWRLGEKG